MQLGRIQPIYQFDYGRFKGVIASDGQLRFFPRLAKHYNAAADTVPPPPGPLGRKDKALLALKQMYRNDVQGCCVISSRLHKYGILALNDNATAPIATNAEVDATYHAACGPGDNGCDMSVVNDYEQRVGMPMGGRLHKADGTVAIDHTSQTLTMVVLDVFGTINVGMNLPQAWYDSPDGADWDTPTGAGARIVGGHEVQAFDFDPIGVWIATWGGIRRITWRAWLSRTWIDETYTSLNSDWYGADNLAPNGIDAATLKADLALAAAGQVPPLPGPTPPPVPVPPPPVPPPVPTGITLAAVKANEHGVLSHVLSTNARILGRTGTAWLTQYQSMLDAANASKFGSVGEPFMLDDPLAGG